MQHPRAGRWLADMQLGDGWDAGIAQKQHNAVLFHISHHIFARRIT
jgi:hypothetical protein